MSDAVQIGSSRYGYVFPKTDFSGSHVKARQNYKDLPCIFCNDETAGFIVQVLYPNNENVQAIKGICWDCGDKHDLSMCPA